MDKYTIALVSDWYYPKAGGIEYSVDSLAPAVLGKLGQAETAAMFRVHAPADAARVAPAPQRRDIGGRDLEPALQVHRFQHGKHFAGSETAGQHFENAEKRVDDSAARAAHDPRW